MSDSLPPTGHPAPRNVSENSLGVPPLGGTAHEPPKGGTPNPGHGSAPMNSQTGSKRSTATTCLILNQFATPGLGSLMARRWFAGTGQLVLAVAGFCLLVGWFVQ